MTWERIVRACQVFIGAVLALTGFAILFLVIWKLVLV